MTISCSNLEVRVRVVHSEKICKCDNSLTGSITNTKHQKRCGQLNYTTLK